MTMFENISLKKMTGYVLAILIFIAVAFSFSAYRQLYQLDRINSSWLSFKSHYTERARLETSLRAVLGYGGMIHEFKNYVLRKNNIYRARVQSSMGAAEVIISQYLALSRTRSEKVALEDISKTLAMYKNRIEIVRQEIKKGKTSKEIDRLVFVDDKYALRGLNALRKEIIKEYSYYKDRKQKSVLAAEIRTDMGYGGMIHAFKNYILRGNKKYYARVSETIKITEDIISEYKSLNPTLGETTALDDISNTLLEYKNKLDLVRKSLSKGLSPEQIDKIVSVDDSRALRGLTSLDQDIIHEITFLSEELSNDLENVNHEQTIYSLFMIIFIFILALFLFYIFTRMIIKPVQKLSLVMSELSHGNTDVSFDYPERSKTELGDIARAFNVFKERENERRLAEKEIRHLAMTDPLTGLANRNQFDRRYEELASLADRENKLLAILALDLDNFKPINDNYGHASGDEVLKSVAKNLLLVFRETDLVARIGGDEFSVVLYAPEDIESVENVARRIISLLSIPVPVGSGALIVGVSIGIVLRQPGSSDTNKLLLNHADEALYEAKGAGRNTYHIYKPE